MSSFGQGRAKGLSSNHYADADTDGSSNPPSDTETPVLTPSAISLPNLDSHHSHHHQPSYTLDLNRHPDADADADAENPLLTNPEIFSTNEAAFAAQDAHLDRLSHTLSAHRSISEQMGRVLHHQAGLLGDLEEGVDSHSGRVTEANRRVHRLSRSESVDTCTVSVIGILILVLVLLIVILK